jgi:hypothetical protein
MGKYLVLWEVVQTQIPIDPKERGDGWGIAQSINYQLLGGQNSLIG